MGHSTAILRKPQCASQFRSAHLKTIVRKHIPSPTKLRCPASQPSLFRYTPHTHAETSSTKWQTPPSRFSPPGPFAPSPRDPSALSCVQTCPTTASSSNRPEERRAGAGVRRRTEARANPVQRLAPDWSKAQGRRSSLAEGAGGAGNRDALEEVPPPPPQGVQPMPSHCLPDGKCQLQRHL